MKKTAESMDNYYDSYGDILSVEDVSRLLDASRQYVYRLIREGRLRGFRIGRGYKVAKSSVIEFMSGRAV
jgi:excisionase family DNA binding protein